MSQTHESSFLLDLKHKIQTTPKNELQQILSKIDNQTCLALLYDWELWAREEQLAPSGSWFCWLLNAGRGWGKTRTGAEWVRSRVDQGYTRIGLIGETAAAIRDVVVEGESGILAISPPWNYPLYEPSKRRLTWPNGAIATTYSAEEPDDLRGPQHDTIWIDELAKFRYVQDVWDNMEFGLRLGKTPRVCVTTTPRPIKIIKKLLSDPQTVTPTTNISTFANKKNLAPQFVSRILTRYEGTRLGRQELYAELMDDVAGALWQRETLETTRVSCFPDLVRVVVGVDPSISQTGDGDEAGIVVVGLGADQHIYVIADYSISGSPLEWATQSVKAYRQHNADVILAESNQGGEMVRQTILNVSAVNVDLVWASRGKYTRAEPISALYEQGLVHHVGAFPLMEDELCSWIQGEKSPNRLDALVWAITGLLQNTEQEIIYYDDRVNISSF